MFYIIMNETVKGPAQVSTFTQRDSIHFGPGFLLGTHGRQRVKTPTSNDCLLCLLHFKPGAICQAFAHTRLQVSVTVTV